MAGSFVGGALLGAAFGELLEAVREATIKYIEFKDLFKRLEQTLIRLAPIIKEIETLNDVLDLHPDETKAYQDQLKEGKRLVLRCAGVRWWNLYDRSRCAMKLAAFEKSLGRFFQIDVTAQISRDGRRTLDGVNRIDQRLKWIETVCGSNRKSNGSSSGGWLVVGGCCEVPEVKGVVFGMKEAIREVKGMVVSGEKVVVVSAPGGCGKTTLAKKVCHDPDVTGNVCAPGARR